MHTHKYHKQRVWKPKNYHKQRVWKPKNYHIATRCRLNKIKQKIENYNKEYPTPKYLQFIKTMLENDWSVKLYVAGVSKYVFVEKDQHIYKIRFSDHKPNYHRELENDCDFYVGISHKTVHKTEEIVSILQEKLNQISDQDFNNLVVTDLPVEMPPVVRSKKL